MFLAPNKAQLCLAQETCVVMTKIVQFDWSVVFLAGVLYHIYCQPCLLCKFLIAENCMNVHRIFDAIKL